MTFAPTRRGMFATWVAPIVEPRVHPNRAGSPPPPPVHEELLRLRHDADGLRDLLRPVLREHTAERLEQVGRGLRRDRAASGGHLRFSSASGFSGFARRSRRFASTRSRMTFMYIASC